MLQEVELFVGGGGVETFMFVGERFFFDITFFVEDGDAALSITRQCLLSKGCSARKANASEDCAFRETLGVEVVRSHQMTLLEPCSVLIFLQRVVKQLSSLSIKFS